MPRLPRLAAEQALAELTRSFSRSAKSGRREQAQQMVYDALEAQSLPEAVRLAELAVKTYPSCVDALVILAQAKSRSKKEEIQRMKEVVEIGAKDLGRNYFKENKGHFWGLLETRPYMRARTYLAQILADQNFIDDAIGHYEAMLDLNPNDNQGLRYPLLGHNLATDRLDNARKLLKEFKDDECAMMTWGRVLERFLSGITHDAEKALTAAREANPFVESYILGKKRVPKNLPEMYGWGDENEAIVCADSLGPAWNKHPSAQDWLAEHKATAPGKDDANEYRAGRNELCPCGSGKKFKFCHGA